jgi:asparagine synthase (glutamine-hydrolysing)
MLGAMSREPFDIVGEWTGDRLGVRVGWVCHGGAFADCLPIWNETKDVCVLFTGEHFGDPDDMHRLRTAGHRFEAEDASALVHLYEDAGPDFIERLNGWFAGVVVDLRTDTIILYNDRYGLNRVYVYEDPDGLLFASEAKALLRVLPNSRRLEPRALAEFVSCGCVLQNRTLFPGLLLLPPASRWTFRLGQPPRKQTYFHPHTWESQRPLSDADFYTSLVETVPRVLKKYVRGPQQIAASLTGGLDSRLIMAWSRHAPGTLPCYSFAGPYRECLDVRIAREVARQCRQPHQTIPVGGHFLEHFPRHAVKAIQISDGLMDVTGSVELYVNEIARSVAPVRLTGSYGSEILRRNIAFNARAIDPAIYDADLVRLAPTAVDTYRAERECHPLSFIAFKQVPWHHHARLSLEQSQLTIRSPYLDNELVRLAYQASSPDIGAAPYLRLIAHGNPALARIPTDRGLRYPPIPVATAVAHLYREFEFRLEYAFDYGMPGWLASLSRSLLPSAVERLILGRHKFSHFRVWYRDTLGPWLKEILLDPQTHSRGHITASRLHSLVIEHTTGRANHTATLHKLLTIELVHRHVIANA